MELKNITLENYRNIEKASLVFDGGVNIITGNNAQGKTSILEGIYVFARGRSYRAKKEDQSVRFGSVSNRCIMRYFDGERENEMGFSCVKSGTRRLCFNGIELNRASEFIGNFRAVLFSPDSLSLIKASPSQRRLFLDVAISQFDHKYVLLLKKFCSLLAQRNKLLKDGVTDGSLYDAYAVQMSVYAAEICQKRFDYLKKVTEYAENNIEIMSGGKEKVEISYRPEINLQDFDKIDDKKYMTELYYKAFTDNLERESVYKTTLYGVHRDDFDIELNGKNARIYCSQGQIRSLTLLLKLAEGEISKNYSGGSPVYLLDDVFGELDEQRRAFLLERLTGMQVIITCCEPIGNTAARLFHVENGKITD